MNYLQHCINALAYTGQSRLRMAWLTFLASYHYTRAHDGAVINSHGDQIQFGRRYAFLCALECGLPYLWKRP